MNRFLLCFSTENEINNHPEGITFIERDSFSIILVLLSHNLAEDFDTVDI